MIFNIETFADYDTRVQGWRGAIRINEFIVWTSDQAFEETWIANELAEEEVVEFFRRGFRYTP